MKAKVIRVAVPQDLRPSARPGSISAAGLRHRYGQSDRKRSRSAGGDHPGDERHRIAYLQTWKADIVISSLGKTPEREKVI